MPDWPVWVTGDPTRLAQVVGNLLHNAAKFTDPGGRVTVRLTPDRKARHSLSQAVAILRQALNAPDLLDADGETVGLRGSQRPI